MSKRKSDGEKRVAGTFRPDRAVHQPALWELEGTAAMPRGVLSGSAQKAWHAWAQDLQALGLLTRLDGPMFALVCTWMGVAMDADRELRVHGIVCDDGRGREAKNRALTVLRAASAELRQLSGAFGLTPADRAGLSLRLPDGEEDIAELLVRMATEAGDGD